MIFLGTKLKIWILSIHGYLLIFGRSSSLDVTAFHSQAFFRDLKKWFRGTTLAKQWKWAFGCLYTDTTLSGNVKLFMAFCIKYNAIFMNINVQLRWRHLWPIVNLAKSTSLKILGKSSVEISEAKELLHGRFVLKFKFCGAQKMFRLTFQGVKRIQAEVKICKLTMSLKQF